MDRLELVVDERESDERRKRATANSRQEDAMHVLDHAEAHRQLRQLLEAVLECADVVVHLAGFAAGGGRKAGGNTEESAS